VRYCVRDMLIRTQSTDKFSSLHSSVYSRAAAKTSLSDLVIDQTNPERSFTKQEMDLLRVEDTWVSCKLCEFML
jgi:hypothetical protein